MYLHELEDIIQYLENDINHHSLNEIYIAMDYSGQQLLADLKRISKQHENSYHELYEDLKEHHGFL